MFISKESDSEEEKEVAAKAAENFTRLFPIYFPDQSITRKIHTLGFTLPDMIRNDKSENICYKYLKLEQAGERVHNIWNTLKRSRFFAIKDSKLKLYYTFLEYENNLYVDKNMFNKNKR